MKNEDDLLLGEDVLFLVKTTCGGPEDDLLLSEDDPVAEGDDLLLGEVSSCW
jgi:hypothetical protein